MTYEVKTGDCLSVLPTIEAGSVQTVVTSPPYFGLRDYGTAKWEGGDENCDHVQTSRPPVVGSSSTLGYPADGGKRRISEGNTYHEAYTVQFRGECGKCGAHRVDSQIGLEETPEAYVSRVVEVFREVRRVLKDDGTLWLNLGDSYAGSGKGGNPEDSPFRKQATNVGSLMKTGDTARQAAVTNITRNVRSEGIKPKDLIGVPWMVAFALRADGWYLRQELIWAKPNPMPESVTDRCTKAHEQIFLLSKSPRYYFDAVAISEPAALASQSRAARGVSETHKNISVPGRTTHSLHKARANGEGYDFPDTRNKRSVWTVSTKPFPEAHFATFPEDLIEPCILAGSREGDTVLDPFSGAGTTGVVAVKHGRKYLGCELNPEYVEMSERRLAVAEAMALRAKGVWAEIPRPIKKEIPAPLFELGGAL